jgi:hypothetical protein
MKTLISCQLICMARELFAEVSLVLSPGQAVRTWSWSFTLYSLSAEFENACSFIFTQDIRLRDLMPSRRTGIASHLLTYYVDALEMRSPAH